MVLSDKLRIENAIKTPQYIAVRLLITGEGIFFQSSNPLVASPECALNGDQNFHKYELGNFGH